MVASPCWLLRGLKVVACAQSLGHQCSLLVLLMRTTASKPRSLKSPPLASGPQGDDSPPPPHHFPVCHQGLTSVVLVPEPECARSRLPWPVLTSGTQHSELSWPCRVHRDRWCLDWLEAILEAARPASGQTHGSSQPACCSQAVGPLGAPTPL